MRHDLKYPELCIIKCDSCDNEQYRVRHSSLHDHGNCPFCKSRLTGNVRKVNIESNNFSDKFINYYLSGTPKSIRSISAPLLFSMMYLVKAAQHPADNKFTISKGVGKYNCWSFDIDFPSPMGEIPKAKIVISSGSYFSTGCVFVSENAMSNDLWSKQSEFIEINCKELIYYITTRAGVLSPTLHAHLTLEAVKDE